MMKTIGPVLVASLLTACVIDEGVETHEEVDRVAADEIEGIEVTEVTHLATVVTTGGAEVRFDQLDTGGIAVSELVRTGELSPMNALMTGEEATPLELFLAIASPEVAVPAELEVAHVEWARANDVDPTPRALILEEKQHAHYSWYYAADCDLADDGGWFDWFWQTYNWKWHWYWRTNSYDGFSATTPKRYAVQSHLCNDGPKGIKIHRVRRSSCFPNSGWSYIFTREVAPEYRSQFRVWDDPHSCYFANRNSSKIGSVNFPTYSHGITTP